jgi:hypothetical protein
MKRRAAIMSKSPEELYEERTKRVHDAVRLKVPDRVPFMPFFTFFWAKYSGMSCREAMYDYDSLAKAGRKLILDFEPDMYNNPFSILAMGPLMEILDSRQFKWPGHGVSPDQTYQFVEEEHMKAEDYDDFLFDPTDYLLRKFIPKIYGALEHFQNLPSLPSLYYMRALTATAAFANPAVAGAVESLLKAGAEAQQMIGKMMAFAKDMKDIGFPSQFASVAYAPMDYLGDFLRGTRGVLMDMLRVPDKLHEVMEKIVPIILRGTLPAAKASGNPFVFMPMHKCPDGFMSLDQFKTFYWRSLKKVIISLIDEDLIPVVLWEGNCESRLETICEIPRGKAVYWFEKTDLIKAKAILGETVCIRGNVPPVLLNTGSVQEVEEYCKKLIDNVGKGGGFIMDGAIGIPDEAKPENVKAMADITKTYGVYG